MKELNFSSPETSFKFHIDDNEEIITNNILLEGTWEHNQLRLYKNLIGNFGTFIDIGANVGVNTIFAALTCPNSKIYSIEPSTINFQLLLKNLKDNSIQNVITKKAAVSAFPGKVNFSGSGTNAKISKNGEESVDSITLDELFIETKFNEIDLLKIDVEGWTDDVLSGGKKTIRLAKNVIVEFSIGDTCERYDINKNQVNSEFCQTISCLKTHLPNVYYISRENGLVEIKDNSDYFHLVELEHSVGDILFSRSNHQSISTTAFLSKKILLLMNENHHRINQINELTQNKK